MIPQQTDFWVSEEFSRLAEVIQDYDPHLELRWIHPSQRTTAVDRAAPYCIFDTRSNYIVMYATELDTPAEILGRLFDADNKHGDVLKRMDAQNAAVKALEMKKHIDAAEEAKDLAAFAIGNEKNVWKHNGVKFDAEMRRLPSGKEIII